MTILVLAPVTASAGREEIRLASDSEIAARFAPILHLDSAEVFWPTDIRAMLDHAEYWANSSMIEGPPIQERTLQDQNSVDASLRLALGSQTPQDSYRAYRLTYENVTYARIVQRPDGSRIVQYWLFYVFNDGFNDHEGDWEMVQVHLDANLLPIAATYSQHNTGRSRHWFEVTREGSHPHAYIAFGSHASYFGPGTQVLASDACGLTGLDASSGDVVLRANADYRVELLSAQTWLAFEGRWGSPGSFEFTSGPRGPTYRTNGCGVSLWEDPWTWSGSMPVERAGPWVGSRPSPPFADAGGSRTILLGDSVELDASRSHDADGSIVRYSWDFGDNTSAEGRVVSRRYQIAQTFTVSLRVIDDAGLSDEDSIAIQVVDPALYHGTNALVSNGSLPAPHDYPKGSDPTSQGPPAAWGWLVIIAAEISMAAFLVGVALRESSTRAGKLK